MNNKDDFILSGSGIDSITVTDTVTLDLDFGAAQPALTTTGFDTITLDDLTNMSSTITLPSSSVYTINTGGGGGGGSGGIYTTNTTGAGYTWSQSYAPTVNITNDGVEVKEGGDIKIGNRSMKEFMTKMEERLAILVPDPERLEKFEALKKAYEHYKTMEALCFPDEKDKKNEC
jgi:hypothetical protein